jgi:hypothetical protein
MVTWHSGSLCTEAIPEFLYLGGNPSGTMAGIHFNTEGFWVQSLHLPLNNKEKYNNHSPENDSRANYTRQ